MGVSCQLHAPAALLPPGERTPGTHCTGGWHQMNLIETRKIVLEIKCTGGQNYRHIVRSLYVVGRTQNGQ
jgi:hypothetical protein